MSCRECISFNRNYIVVKNPQLECIILYIQTNYLPFNPLGKNYSITTSGNNFTYTLYTLLNAINSLSTSYDDSSSFPFDTFSNNTLLAYKVCILQIVLENLPICDNCHIVEVLLCFAYSCSA